MLHLLIFTILIVTSSCAHKTKNSLPEMSIDSQISQVEEVKDRLDFLRAHSISLEDQHQKALEIYNHLVTKYPQDFFLKKKYALELIREQKIEEAAPLLEKIYKKEPDELTGLLLANTFWQNQKFSPAIAVLNKNIELFPHSSDSCLQLARMLIFLKKTQLATTTLTKCKDKNQEDADIDYLLGEMSLSQRNDSLAEKHFFSALEKNPLHFQSAIKLGMIYEKQSPQKALALYKQMASNRPDQILFLEKILQISNEMGQSIENISWLEKLVAINPESVDNQVRLGLMYAQDKNYTSALNVFNMLEAKLHGSEKIQYYLALIYAEKQDLNSALSYFSKIHEDQELLQQSTLHQAQILHLLALREKNNESKQRFLDFVNHHEKGMPQLGLPLSILKANYYEEEKNYNLAIEALRIHEQDTQFGQNHHYYMATLFDKAKRFDEAKEVIWKILKSNPHYAHAWNYLGYNLLEKNHNLPLAHNYIQKAYKILPHDGMILDSMGWYHYKKKNFFKALEYLHLAYQKTGDDLTILKHLAETYSALNNVDEAKRFYAEAIKKTPEANEKAELLQLLANLEERNSKRLPSSYQTHP